MRPRPNQDVRIWTIQQRQSNVRPWIVRWAIEGKQRSRSFRTKAEADRLRSQLVVAQQNGEPFDPRTGQPLSWTPSTGQMKVYAWARQWVADDWAEWAPRTRDSQVEGLYRFVPLAVDPRAPDPPWGLRMYLTRALRPDAELDPDDECERWLVRWGLSLDELNEENLAEVERRLGLGDEGQTLSPNTSNRYRGIAHSCIRRAVELKKIPADPWPPTPRGRARRKARRQRKSIDIERLPDPQTMQAIIAAIRSHQPSSRTYQVMTAVAYYAGLRPSEVMMLRPRALDLPDEGWGRISVVEADDGYDEPAEPKTGPRQVPILPVLVSTLRSRIDELGAGPDQLLFRTQTGRRPSQSNWNRALKRATESVGYRPISAYECRHACATTWLQAGVPLGEAALHLGHSVETLVTHYVGALQGDDRLANERIEATLSVSSPGATAERP